MYHQPKSVSAMLVVTTVAAGIAFFGCHNRGVSYRFGQPTWGVEAPPRLVVEGVDNDYNAEYTVTMPPMTGTNRKTVITCSLAFQLLTGAGDPVYGIESNHWSAYLVLEWDGNELTVPDYAISPKESWALHGKRIRWRCTPERLANNALRLRFDFSYYGDRIDTPYSSQEMNLTIRVIRGDDR